MQFSVIFEAQLANPTRQREQQLIRDCLEQAIFAEEMGFDRVWAVEHHSLYWYAHMSAPEIFLTAVAARTSRIRIGHGVVCMPFNYNYPTRVAERAAMLDIISDGRLDLGAGRGGTAQEMSLCNVDPERTVAEVREALQIIGQIWLGDEFVWHGDLLDIEAPAGAPRHIVVPRPVQTPHPPLFLACTHADTVRTAAQYGVGALAFAFAGLDHVRKLRKTYDEAIAVPHRGHVGGDRGERPPGGLVPDHRARRSGAGAPDRRPGAAVLRGVDQPLGPPGSAGAQRELRDRGQRGVHAGHEDDHGGARAFGASCRST